ncbi:MAG: hypothetical protein C5B50_19050 [Verrucomicrobia bacterium]|nr:MAG: hypothetical protein C5B50_19050 [Verrucomicrobiota bacterium]
MKKHIVLTLGLATVLVSAAQAGQEQLAASIKQAREEAASTATQLSTTLTALNTLVGTKGDLNPCYQAFRSEIPKTESAATVTRARLETMTKERENYFRDWQATIQGINNPSLQKKAQKRLDAAAKSYDKVQEEMKAAADKFRPFLSDLSDIDKALSHDVTADGIKSMKSTVRSANWNYKFVSSAIKDALKEMDKMEKALSAQSS